MMQGLEPMYLAIAFLSPVEYRPYTHEEREAILRLAKQLEQLPPERFCTGKGGTA